MPIELKNLYYTYSKGTPYELRALNGINLTIEDGQFVGLIGHTGSGKSTLVSHLNGLIVADEGFYRFNGEDVYQSSYSKRNLRFQVGLVFQYPEHQLFESTVLKDVCFGPKNMGLSEEEQIVRAKSALDLVGLSKNVYEMSPFELSGGQKRRVAIAGVLAMHPSVLVLDEPTAGLDPRGRDEILELIRHLHEKEGMTIILVSHSMEDVANYVERIIVIDKGAIVIDGSPKDVFLKKDELETMGLAVPSVMYLLSNLKECGFDVNTSCITVAETVQTIKDAIAKKKCVSEGIDNA